MKMRETLCENVGYCWIVRGPTSPARFCIYPDMIRQIVQISITPSLLTILNLKFILCCVYYKSFVREMCWIILLCHKDIYKTKTLVGNAKKKKAINYLLNAAFL